MGLWSPIAWLGIWRSEFLKMSWAFFWPFHGWWWLNLQVLPDLGRPSASLLRLWSGDIPGGQIFACKLHNWSAMVSAAAGDLRKASSSSDPWSFAYQEWAHSTQFLQEVFRSYTVHRCHPHPSPPLWDLTYWTWLWKGVVDVAEAQAACCWWGMLGPCQPQPFMQTKSLIWLDWGLYNSPLPGFVNFLFFFLRETQVLVMYAGIQTGTLTVVTAGCREETVPLLSKKRGKRWKK